MQPLAKWSHFDVIQRSYTCSRDSFVFLHDIHVRSSLTSLASQASPRGLRRQTPALNSGIFTSGMIQTEAMKAPITCSLPLEHCSLWRASIGLAPSCGLFHWFNLFVLCSPMEAEHSSERLLLWRYQVLRGSSRSRLP